MNKRTLSLLIIIIAVFFAIKNWSLIKNWLLVRLRPTVIEEINEPISENTGGCSIDA